MSVSFRWKVIKPEKSPCFAHGMSSDHKALHTTFPQGTVSTDDFPVLRAMHLATGDEHSLWSDIAKTLERLQGDDCERAVKIEVWEEY